MPPLLAMINGNAQSMRGSYSSVTSQLAGGRRASHECNTLLSPVTTVEYMEERPYSRHWQWWLQYELSE